MTDAGWDPAGDVLVVGHSIDQSVLGDIHRRLTGISVHVLDLDEFAIPDDPTEPDDESVETGAAADSPFPPESNRAVEQISLQLEAHPGVTTLLAQSRWAARDIWRIVRDRPELLGFTHLDNLERARIQGLVIDVTPHGRRRNSHRFSAEFAGDDIGWDPGARIRVLVGPTNEHGRSAGWARALRRLRRVDAISLAVGDEGFPAEVMATTSDWENKGVRRAIVELVASATHVLLDDTDSEIVTEVRARATGRVTEGGANHLPVTAVPGNAAPTGHAVVIDGDPTTVPDRWRVTDLTVVPPGLWTATAMTADLIVDQRSQPHLDVPVVSAMGQGALLVVDLPAHRLLRRSVPHVKSLTDPALADDQTVGRLRRDTARYVKDRHSDDVVARRLRRVLGVG